WGRRGALASIRSRADGCSQPCPEHLVDLTIRYVRRDLGNRNYIWRARFSADGSVRTTRLETDRSARAPECDCLSALSTCAPLRRETRRQTETPGTQLPRRRLRRPDIAPSPCDVGAS